MTSRAVSAIACFAGEYAATRRESRTFPEPDNEERGPVCFSITYWIHGRRNRLTFT